jgi:hypothetical protein
MLVRPWLCGNCNLMSFLGTCFPKEYVCFKLVGTVLYCQCCCSLFLCCEVTWRSNCRTVCFPKSERSCIVIVGVPLLCGDRNMFLSTGSTESSNRSRPWRRLLRRRHRLKSERNR